MSIKYAVIIISALALAVAGCGGKKSQPAIAPAVSTVGTLSKESAAQPIVQDMTAIRTAMNSGQADNAFTGIYDLVNRAVADKSAGHGAATIRRELPGLVSTLVQSYPSVRARVAALKPKTKTGAEFKSFALDILHDDLVLSQSLNADVVAHSQNVFLPVERWGGKTNAAFHKDDARLQEILAHAPAGQRAALMRAVREIFGSQVP